jgi:hypothetical protein
LSRSGKLFGLGSSSVYIVRARWKLQIFERLGRETLNDGLHRTRTEQLLQVWMEIARHDLNFSSTGRDLAFVRDTLLQTVIARARRNVAFIKDAVGIAVRPRADVRHVVAATVASNDFLEAPRPRLRRRHCVDRP